MTKKEIQIIARIAAESDNFGILPYHNEEWILREAFGFKGEMKIPSGYYLYFDTDEDYNEISPDTWLGPDFILECRFNGKGILLYRIEVEE